MSRLLSDFAFAIGASPKSVRLWLGRGQAFPHARAETGDWARFTEDDVAVGAIMIAVMNTLNVPVREADEIARRIVQPGHYAMLPSSDGSLVRTELEPIQPPPDVESRFENKLVVLVRADSGPRWRIATVPVGHRLTAPQADSRVRVLLDAHGIITAGLARFRARASARALLHQTTRREVA